MAVGSSNDFDLVVLGAGTGGYSAAFRAAQLGLKVALVDEDKIGGTCLHRGCIPTKALLESAAFTDKVRHAKEYGLVLPGEAVVDYAAMAARRDAVVKRMWTGLKTLIDKNKVTWVAGRGRLDGPGKIKVSQTGEDGTPGGGGERILNATDVILATGSRVKSLPGLTPDGKRILTSDDVLKLDTLPKDIVIVGAGAVGVEFASMYADVGVKVTVLEYLPQIVPLEDADVSKVVERSFTKRGITVMTNARFDATSVTADDNGICLMVGPEGKDPAELRAEVMLVATGRSANIEDIGLETTKVETERGVIKVNGRMRTREPHVYAIGDAIGGLWLAHTAAHEGLTAAHTIAGDPDVHDMDYTSQPRATYCRPEIASIGLTEAAGDGGRTPAEDRQGPVPGDRQGDHRRRVRGLRQGHRRRRQQRHARRPHHRAARHRPDRGGVARLRARGDAVGDRRRDPRAPDPVRGHRRGRHGRRRAVDQLLGSQAGPRPGITRRPDRQHDGHPRQRLPPRGEPRPDRRRPARDVPLRRARARGRRADVDPQPRRPDPVRDQRPGSRGRAGRHRLGVRPRQGLDRAVLPLGRDLPDVRDERARHHDRPVRDGIRPIVGRAPDARPLRQPRAQHRVGVVAGGDPAAPRGRASPWRPRSARRARSR